MPGQLEPIAIPAQTSAEAYLIHINQREEPYIFGRPTSLNCPAKTVSLIIGTEGSNFVQPGMDNPMLLCQA